jgi:hypothetical protein
MLDTATDSEAEIAALLGSILTNKDSKVIKQQDTNMQIQRSKWKINRVQ